jgi:flagellar operon protein
MNVRGVSAPVLPTAPTRATMDVAPGFGEAMESLLRARPTTGPSPALVETPATSGTLQFSRHAQARMASRGITLDDQDVTDLSCAIDSLARRGAKESLLIMEDHAFIVGVPERKVITAMTRREAVGTIFTQIDSTVVVR